MRRPRHKLQVSTFPFLAVLLCAMGALLLVLLVMDRRAHYAARARADQAARRAAEEATRDTESRRAALEQARQEALAARQRERDAEHAHLESQVAAVQGKAQSVRDQLAQAADRLRTEQDDETALKPKINAERARADAEQQAILQARGEAAKNAAESEAARKEREAMTADLAQLERTLADLKAAREKEQKTYSVVPYNGKHGDNRRPLYIECAGDQVIFHPDRLSLPESSIGTDGEAEVQRRLARQKEQLPPAQASAFAPYLMLLVRPDGVVSYYRLRDALHGLKIDFGYEFIDADWALDFPADDEAAPAQAWMTAAKPVAAAPSTTPPGSPLAGVKPGYGSAASQPPGGKAGNGTDEPSTVAPSTGGAAPAKPGGMAGPHATGGPAGSLFGSVKSDTNGPPTGPAGDGPQAPPVGAGAGSGPHGPSLTEGPPPVPGPPGSRAGGATTGQGTTNAASGAMKDTAAPGLPPVPSPAVALAQSANAPSGAPKAGQPGASSNAGVKDAAPPQAASPGAGMTKATPGAAHADGPDDDPFLRTPPPPPLPNTGRPAPSLRPARLSGDRDWTVYVECKAEGVVIYPTQLLVPASALARPSGSNPLMQSIQQLIDRKQATIRPGDAPYRPEVRFLVHPDAGRTYHLAYPMLDGLAAPKTGQTLTPDDDVSVIVTGH